MCPEKEEGSGHSRRCHAGIIQGVHRQDFEFFSRLYNIDISPFTGKIQFSVCCYPGGGELVVFPDLLFIYEFTCFCLKTFQSALTLQIVQKVSIDERGLHVL